MIFMYRFRENIQSRLNIIDDLYTFFFELNSENFRMNFILFKNVKSDIKFKTV